MPTNYFEKLKLALGGYDKRKGFWRRWFGDQTAIKKLRSLSPNDHDNLFKICQCFFKNTPKPSQASYQVYQKLANLGKFSNLCLKKFQEITPSHKQQINLESKVIQELISNNIIAFEQALSLNPIQRGNLELDVVQNLIAKKIISLDQVLSLFDSEQTNLGSEAIQKLILDNEVDFNQALSLNPIQLENLELSVIRELISKKVINLDQVLDLSKVLSDLEQTNLGSKAIQELILDNEIDFNQASLLTPIQRENLKLEIVKDLLKSKSIDLNQVLSLTEKFIVNKNQQTKQESRKMLNSINDNQAPNFSSVSSDKDNSTNIPSHENTITNKKVIAIDCSGSTFWDSNPEYWYKVKHHLLELEQIDAQNKDVLCILWDSYVVETITVEQLITHLTTNKKYKKGGGGTAPSSFIPKLASDQKEIVLTVFTDGQISASEINKCDDSLQKIGVKFKQLTVLFVGPEDNMNLSVPAPFMREWCTPKEGVKCKIKVNDKITTEKTFQVISIKIKPEWWNNPQLFLVDASELLKQLEESILQNLALVAQSEKLRTNLIRLKNNLLKSIAESKKTDAIKEIEHNLTKALESQDREAAEEQLKNLLTGLQNLPTQDEEKIEDIFQALLICLDKRSDLSFGQLDSSNRLTRAREVKKVNISKVEAEQIEKNVQFECPILLENDCPVLLIKSGEEHQPILQGLSKKEQDYFINNPLAILDCPDLVKKIKERLDHPVGFTSVKDLFVGNSSISSPITRSTISSFISTADELSHKNATHYALADLFFGKKLCGVPELWLAVVYLIAKKTTYLNQESEESNFINVFKESLACQLKNNSTNMALSGLAEHGPLLKVPVALALWYCVMSPQLTDKPDRLATIGTVHHLELLDELNYPFNREQVLNQLKSYQFNQLTDWIMDYAKKTPIQFDKWIGSLHQNSIVVNGEIVFLDGPAQSQNNFKVVIQKLNISLLLVEEIIALVNFIKGHKNLKDISIPNNLTSISANSPILEIPTVAEKNYSFKNKCNDGSELCPFTLRPYSLDPSSKNKWQQIAEEKFGPLADQISHYNEFFRYVSKNKKFPSPDEYIRWLSNRLSQRKSNPKNTLPINYEIEIANLFSDIAEAITKLFSTENVNQARELFENYKKVEKHYSKNSGDPTVNLFKKINSLNLDKDNPSHYIDSVNKLFSEAYVDAKERIPGSAKLFLNNKDIEKLTNKIPYIRSNVDYQKLISRELQINPFKLLGRYLVNLFLEITRSSLDKAKRLELESAYSNCSSKSQNSRVEFNSMRNGVLFRNTTDGGETEQNQTNISIYQASS